MSEVVDLREMFPGLAQKIGEFPLVYLDNAATTQKYGPVIVEICKHYLESNANVHRGVHTLSQRADKAYAAARSSAKRFIHAKSLDEIVFTYGTTDAINLLAFSLGERHIAANDEIIISEIEHHANIVPWQQLCARKGALLKVIPVKNDGSLDLKAYAKLLSPKTKIVSLSMISNVLGIMNPVKKIIQMAHEQKALVVLDAAQSVSHQKIDVQDLDCDFLVFSSHKMFGPTGVGILYGKEVHLSNLPPYRTGGGMIDEVSFEKTTFAGIPNRFEAGTPPIEAVIGMAVAMDFLYKLDFSWVTEYEEKLSAYLWEALAKRKDIEILGEYHDRIPLVSFNLKGAHPHDVATILDAHGVAVRAGHHCAMPLMQKFNVNATVRASATIYNSSDDIDALLEGLNAVKGVLCDA